MDDTIEHLSEACVSWLNDKYGTTVRCDDICSWDFSKAFPNLSRNQVYKPLKEDDFWDTVKPMDGAADVLRSLTQDGHEVYIVTASLYQTIPAKMERVLFRYFPFLSWQNVIIASNKQMIDGDIMIDDAPHNLLGGRYAKILMSAPHNRYFNAIRNGITRVSNWEQAKQVLDIMVKLKNSE